MKSLTQRFVPLASTLVIGSVLNPDSGLAATLNFQDVTQGLLRFRDSTETQIGSGSFEYSQAPVEGTFLFGTGPAVGGLGAYFVTDPSRIPENFVPTQAISISAAQNLRLVTSTSIDILGATFENQRADLSRGQFSGTALLFQPTQNKFFPPGPGGPFEVSAGGRNPSLSSRNAWFLGDPRGAEQQLLIDSDGSFVGFDSDVAPQGFSGKWEAEAVPEPLSVLGAAGALGFGLHFKNKNGKKKTLKVKEKAKA